MNFIRDLVLLSKAIQHSIKHTCRIRSDHVLLIVFNTASTKNGLTLILLIEYASSSQS